MTRGMPIVDAVEKLTGAVRYVADLTLPEMVHGRLVVSPFAAARIREIDTSAATAVPGVVAVLTAVDLPTAGLPATDRNSAILATEHVVWQGQPVAIVLAETEAAAADAVPLVEVDYEPLPAVVDVVAAADPGSPLVWPEGLERGAGASADVHAGGAASGGEHDRASGNVVDVVRLHRGDPDAGFAEADVVVELTFRVPGAYQGYLEPHACLAAVDPMDGHLTIWTSTQAVFSTRDGTAKLLGLPPERVRIVPMTVGGGFGAKYGIFEPLAGAAALATGRPVRLVLTRSEDFAAGTPAPATVFRVRAGATSDARLVALSGEILVDSGAFACGLAGLVATLFGSTYRVPHLDVVAREVLTNKPMAGAYRAPGAPQAAFAVESTIDELCRRLDLDPLEFRLANACRTGDPMANGKPWPSIGIEECLRAAAGHPLWRDRDQLPEGHGVGLAVGGWPGGTAPAAAVCRADSDGRLYLHVGSVDLTGTRTAMKIIAAEIIGISPDDVEVVPGDSSTMPLAGPAGGSMVTYTVGSAVAEAAQGARRQILEIAADLLEASVDDLEIAEGVVRVRGAPGAELPVRRIAAEGARFQGRYPPITALGRCAITTQSPGFTVQLVEVSVDRETGTVRVLRDVVIQDVGHAIDPPLVEGQIHGGATQGLAWALSEQLVHDATGQLLTGSFAGYLLPEAVQVPPIEPVLVENPSPVGPLGARGVGEPPIVAGPAAVANAVRDAVGARVCDLPITGDRLWRALAG